MKQHDKGGCETDLYFTIEGLRKAARDIKGYCKTTPYLRANKFYQQTDGEDMVDDYVHFMIVLRKDVDDKLEDLFGEEDGMQGCKYRNIFFIFERTSENARYWRLNREGRPLCAERYAKVIDGKETYESCPCPNEFIPVCRELTDILKKHSIVPKTKSPFKFNQ